jgi:hypothetical protein
MREVAVPARPTSSGGAPQSAGLGDYVKEAFLFRWNLLLFFGSAAAATLLPDTSVLLPLVLAGELSFLTGLISIPRFRAAIDAKVHAAGSAVAAAVAPAQPAVAVGTMLTGLPAEARTRFDRLRARCLEMRTIAAGVRGATGDQSAAAEQIRTPGLDRLLWLFLRLLLSKTALDQFLTTIDENEIKGRLEHLHKDMTAAQAAAPPGSADDRIVKSLQDSIAMAELRLDNHDRAKKNAQFVSIELDRIEGKIQALAEMAVNRQDPDFLSSQVDSAAESMQQTEKAVTELQHLTGLADELQEPPSLLDANLQGATRHTA